MTNATSLDRSIVRAIAWNAAARWLAQIFSWASVVVIARLLTPYDYGLVSMAGLYLNLAMMIGTGGLGDSVVVFRDLSVNQVSQLNTVSLLTGSALIVLSVILAHPISSFFKAPPLSGIILVSSVWYLISAFQVVPKGLLQKELRFKLLAVIETTKAFFQAFVTIVCAFFHLRYWSLVAGYLGGSTIASLLTLYCRRQGFAWPRFAQIWTEVKYSIHIISSRVALYAYDNADFGVSGRVLGEVPLGNYSVAWTISAAPVEKIANLVTGVTPAYFSAIQKNQPELQRYLLRITETLSLITLPASIGLALSAEFLVPALLGSKWTGAIGPLRLLGIFVAARSVTTILPNVLTSVGQAAYVMKLSIVAAVFMPFAFLIGSRWGTTGIAAAWVVAYPIITAPMLYRTLRVTATNWKQYFDALTPALTSSLFMAALILIVKSFLRTRLNVLYSLGIIIVLGLCSYVSALWYLRRDRVRNVMGALFNAFKKE